MLRFQIAGVPVRVQPFFFLIIAALGAGLVGAPMQLAAWVAIAFTGILAHEFGHAAAFRAFGHAPTIELHGFGGQTSSRNARNLTPWQDVVVSLAGPGVGIVIGAAAWLLPAETLLAQRILLQVIWVNLGWGLLNLLPMLPLDGGRIMAATLRRFSPHASERIASGISVAIAAMMLLVALRVGSTWGALLCGLFGWNNFQRFRALRAVGPDRPLLDSIAGGFRRLEAGDLAAADAIAIESLARAQRDTTRHEALRLRTWVQLAARRGSVALDVLESAPGLAQKDPLLHGLALRAAGRPADAVAPLASAFDAEPSEIAGSNLVSALLEAGELQRIEDLAHSPRAAALSEASLARLEEALLAGGRPAPALLLSERRHKHSRSPAAALGAARACAALGDSAGSLSWLRRVVDGGLEIPWDAPEFASLRGSPDFEALRR